MGDKIKRFIDFNFPVTTCNLRCHYCYITQNHEFDKELPKLNLNYFNSGEVKGVVSKMVEAKINEHVKEVAPQVYEKYQIEDCYMPWCRMFEVALKVKER